MKYIATKIALFSVLVVLFFSGCKDFWHPEGSKQNPSNNNNSNNNNSNNNSPIVGTWYGVWNGTSLIMTFRGDYDICQLSFYGGDAGVSCSYSDGGTQVIIDGIDSYFLAATCRLLNPNQLEVTFHLPDYDSDTVLLTR
jgi:hypothetical protein